jgi:O-antigen/teichoic acid export membrane protein
LGVGALLATRRERPATLHPLERRAWLRFSTVNWIGLVGSQGPMFIIPLVVAIEVTSADYAPFYIAWAVTQMTFLLPHMMGQAYLAESSKHVETDGRLTLRMSLGVMAGVAVAAVPAGMVLGRTLGPDYLVVGQLLPWLLAGCIPWAVTSMHLAYARRRHEDGIVVVITAAFFIITVGVTALVTPLAGIPGAAAAWVIGNLAVALVAIRLAAARRSVNIPEFLAVDFDRVDLDLEGVAR